MVEHLGRLKVVTRRKDGKCSYKYCEKANIIRPREQVVLLTKSGQISGRLTIFYKAYHPNCFGLWLLWKIEQIPLSKDGRRVMDLSPEIKEDRALLIRTRARLIRSLRGVKTGDKLDKLVERISGLDNQIRETGYPAIPYKGRKSKMDTVYEDFLKRVKERYKDPRRITRQIREEFVKMGMEERFNHDLNAWYKEKVKKAQEGQGSDWETEHTDVEEE